MVVSANQWTSLWIAPSRIASNPETSRCSLCTTRPLSHGRALATAIMCNTERQKAWQPQKNHSSMISNQENSLAGQYFVKAKVRNTLIGEQSKAQPFSPKRQYRATVAPIWLCQEVGVAIAIVLTTGSSRRRLLSEEKYRSTHELLGNGWWHLPWALWCVRFHRRFWSRQFRPDFVHVALWTGRCFQHLDWAHGRFEQLRRTARLYRLPPHGHRSRLPFHWRCVNRITGNCTCWRMDDTHHGRRIHRDHRPGDRYRIRVPGSGRLRRLC